MKHLEYYRKHKTRYPSIVKPIFSRRNWGYVILMAVVAILIECSIIYGRQRSVSFSIYDYFRLMEYLSFMVVPFVGFLFWINWRELKRRNKGYCWEGKFEVTGKRSFAFCYLMLAPGKDHKLRVDRSLFDKIRIGDFVLIRRDALGSIEEISKVDNFSSRLAKAGVRHFLKRSSKLV